LAQVWLGVHSRYSQPPQRKAMKAVFFNLFLVFGIALATSGGDASKGDRTITKVVKLLSKMLDKSKKDSDSDGVAYAKYKCYVDSNEAEKKSSVKKLSEQIELLSSKIQELQARNGELSSQTASLNANLVENKAGQQSATEVRKNSAKAFKAMEADLVTGIGQMREALRVLNAIALDQTKTGAFRKKDAMLLSLGSEAQNALNAVSVLLPAERRQSLDAFLQSPLSAAHTAQGDAIVGILKNLLGTFKSNLGNARASEKAEKKAFEDSITTLQSSHGKQSKSLKEKKQEMGDNDGELSSRKTSLEEATKQKRSDEKFLQTLRDMAGQKAQDYDERKMLRANEDAAIAEAISILNSDEAFANFGDVDATSSGKTGFLQLRSQAGTVRRAAQLVLEHVGGRVAQVALGLRVGNPFNKVLPEIVKMKKTVAAEGSADLENKVWCVKERANSNKNRKAKKSQMQTLNEAIDKLEETMDDPKTGVKQQISETEISLLENKKAQTDQAKTRKGESAAYHGDARDLSNAEDILGKAMAVLTKYYKALDKKMKEKKAFIQEKQSKLQAPPKTYDAYEGQSKSGGEAMQMLEFIMGETKKEHQKADMDEKTASKAFADSMSKLKKDEANMQKAFVKLNQDLTEKQKELMEKQTDLKDTTKAKVAIEQYLAKIKPGCDFIAANFQLREKSRATETKALDKAVKLIKGTAAFKDAVADAKALRAGKCKRQCRLDTSNLSCKACAAGFSKKSYCKRHSSFPGCK